MHSAAAWRSGSAGPEARARVGHVHDAPAVQGDGPDDGEEDQRDDGKNQRGEWPFWFVSGGGGGGAGAGTGEGGAHRGPSCVGACGCSRGRCALWEKSLCLGVSWNAARGKGEAGWAVVVAVVVASPGSPHVAAGRQHCGRRRLLPIFAPASTRRAAPPTAAAPGSRALDPGPGPEIVRPLPGCNVCPRGRQFLLPLCLLPPAAESQMTRPRRQADIARRRAHESLSRHSRRPPP